MTVLVLVNKESKTITICDKEVITLSWANMTQVSLLLKNKKVLYVQDAIEVSGQEIINLISSECEDFSNIDCFEDTGEVYICSTVGFLNIPLADEWNLSFKGINHFINIDDIGGMECFDLYPILKTALDIGKIELISASQRQQRIKYFNSQDHRSPKDINAESIIIDRSKEDEDGNPIKASPTQSIGVEVNDNYDLKTTSKKDVIVMDMSQDIEEEPVQEVLNNIKNLGIKDNGNIEIDAD